MPTKEDDILKQRQSFFEHQMALRQLLLRFWVTDHGHCHFREESLEKVTVVTFKRSEEISKSSNTRFTEFTEFARWAGQRGARHSCVHFAVGLGSFKNGINGKWPPREF